MNMAKNCSNSSNKNQSSNKATAEDLTDQRTRIKTKVLFLLAYAHHRLLELTSIFYRKEESLCRFHKDSSFLISTHHLHMLTKRGLLWNLKIYH